MIASSRIALQQATNASPLISLLSMLPDAREQHCSRGEVIVHSFVRQDNVYVITSGFVKVYAIDSEGGLKTQLIQSAGEIFPIAGIVDQPNTGSEFEAMTNCTVLCLPKRTVQQLLAERLDVSQMLLKQVARQFTASTVWVYNLTFKHARKRIIYRLLDMGYRFGIIRSDGAIMLPEFNQVQIAETVNMTRECVNRELQYLERKGYIRHFANRIMVVDPEGLRREAGMEEETFLSDS